jgi:DNA-binding HxlR family transcriptional regulator
MSRSPRNREQPCSIARTASVLADPWVFVLLRDAFRGIRRFEDFQALSGAARSVIAARLGQLVDAQVLRKVRYSERPPRFDYLLTPAGVAFFPAFMEMMAWGDAYLSTAAGTPMLVRHTVCGSVTQPAATCRHCGARLLPAEVRFEAGPGATGPEARRMAAALATARSRDQRLTEEGGRHHEKAAARQSPAWPLHKR